MLLSHGRFGLKYGRVLYGEMIHSQFVEKNFSEIRCMSSNLFLSEKGVGRHLREVPVRSANILSLLPFFMLPKNLITENIIKQIMSTDLKL